MENYLEVDKKLFSSIVTFSNQSTMNSDNEFQKKNWMLDKLVITDKRWKREVRREHVNTVKLEILKEKLYHTSILKVDIWEHLKEPIKPVHYGIAN